MVAAAALVGVAAIHFAYAPSHFDEETSHGVFFVVVAWLQVAAVVALLRWRDRSEPWLAAAALSLGVSAVWLVSRTTGLPGEASEDVGLADAMATGLQLVVVLAAVAALRPALASRPLARINPLVGAAATVLLVGAVSVSLNPDSGGHSHSDGGDEHEVEGEQAANGDGEHGAHGAHGGGQVEQTVARDERCDLGFNTPTFNETAVQAEPEVHTDGTHEVDFTVEEWAEVFVNEDNPMGDGYSPEEVVAFLNTDPRLAEGVVSGGLTHSLTPDNWQPMTDHEECAQLADELERTRAVAERYPKAQDAIEAGYGMVTPYLPTIASHYLNSAYMGEFDIDNPAMLLYDGNGPNANLVGISHYLLGDPEEPPDVGFTGPNDHWHRHLGLCMANGLISGGSNLTEEECAELGGFKLDGRDQYMNHVWVVPGCESDWGLFSGGNPALVVRGTPENPNPFDPQNNRRDIPAGCGSDLAVDDELEMDEGGHGPGI